jgi:hypothetical protein
MSFNRNLIHKQILTDQLLAEYHLVLYADQVANVQIRCKNGGNQHMLDETTDLKKHNSWLTLMICQQKHNIQAQTMMLTRT